MRLEIRRETRREKNVKTWAKIILKMGGGE